jgi:hypothetical protein
MTIRQAELSAATVNKLLTILSGRGKKNRRAMGVDAHLSALHPSTHERHEADREKGRLDDPRLGLVDLHQ